MNTLVLVMGLVGLSYLSGLFGRGRSLRGIGLQSGSEWIVVGFLLGPALLGVIDRTLQIDIEPVLYVAIGWVGFVVGLDYGVVRSRAVHRGRLIAGAGLGFVTVAIISAIAWLLIPRFEHGVLGLDRWALALGLGAVACETTSNAARWLSERHGSGGPLAELLDDMAEAKDVAPVLVGCVGLCLHPRFDIAHRGWLVAAVTPAAVLVIGALLGVVASIMLSREERTDQSWGIVIGTALLATGTSARLRLPVVAPLFMLGLLLAMTSRHRRRLLALLEPTKRSALLPALLLAGARIDPHLFVRHGLIVAAVLVTRAVVLYLSGLVIAPASHARAAAPVLGWAMLPTGEISMCIGLSFALTFPDTIGDIVLVTAAMVTLVGELAGPFALRAALRRVGELDATGPIEVKS